jgi:hypothetical protein
MKIISKYKDYYDYLQGIYGVDEKLTLDRTNFNIMKYGPSYSCLIEIYIGEWLVHGFYDKDTKRYYFGDDIEQFSTEFPYYYNNSVANKDTHYYVKLEEFRTYKILFILKEPKHLGDTSVTWEKECPILIREISHNGHNPDNYINFPILREYNVGSMVDAHTVWIWLSEWLGKNITKNEHEVPVGDDKVRIVSAGFDLKDSFRNNKK